MNSLCLGADTEIVFQPYGAFMVSRSLNRFDVVNEQGAAIVLKFVNPKTRDEVEGWAVDQDGDATVVSEFIDGLVNRGYLASPVPGERALLSFAEDARVLKATRAEIEITNRCNLHCVYCYAEVNSSDVERNADEWISLLSGMYDHGLRAVLFSGGEPFLHDEFLRILEWAAPRLVVEVNTNGTYITAEIANFLSELNLKTVQVSLDSPTPDHHDRLRGRGSHAAAISALRLLGEAGVPTQISAVVTSANRDLVQDLVPLANKLRARVKADPVTRTGFAKRISDERWTDQFAASSEDRLEARDPIEASLGYEPVCQSQVGYVAVSHHGILKPCNMREQFFEPTGGVLMEKPESNWWNGYYGRTGLASLAETARQIRGEQAEALQGEARGFLCELQLSAAADGHTQGVPVVLGTRPSGS